LLPNLRPPSAQPLACGDGVRSGKGAALVAALVAALGRRRLAAHERACPFQILLVGCSPVLSAHLLQRHTICRCGSCADEVCGSLSRESVKLRRAIDAIAASFCVRLRCATPCPRYACFDSVVLRVSVLVRRCRPAKHNSGMFSIARSTFECCEPSRRMRQRYSAIASEPVTGLQLEHCRSALSRRFV
jgi:hypothetical protein